MNIAIIPARGGSRRIPRKNIKKFNGKPIIYWSIKCALQTKLFDQVIVSTDDKDIARLSKKFGAKVPFMRPTNLSHNSVGIIKVISSAVKWIVKNENKIKYVCCIFPTSPLMKAKDIQLGYKKIVKNKLSYVFSGASYPSSIYRSFSLDKNNKNLKICFKKKFNKKNNSNLKFFYDAGQFYWGTKEAWVKKRNIFSSKSAILEIPRWRTQDINDNKDWITAQNLFKGIKKMKKNKIKKKLKIINKIEKVRSKNNTNWMDILRLAFRHAPKDASKLLKKIHSQDKIISNLASKLSKK